MGIMIGPILGPPLGGFLTENYSWRWVFLINLPVGLLALAGIFASVKKEPTHERPVDGIGLGLLALGIGGLQLMLDRGQGEDWFGSLEVQIEAAVAFLALYLYRLVVVEPPRALLARSRFVEERQFRRRLRADLRRRHRAVRDAGLVAAVSQQPHALSGAHHRPGAGAARRRHDVQHDAVGRLLGRIDARWLILTGMVLMVYSLYGMTAFGPEVSMSAVVWLGVIQGMGLGLVFVPISTIAYATLEPHQRTEAAGLFSLIRNIGSSVGISVVFTMLSRANQIGHAEIGSRIPAFGAETTLLPALWNPSTQAGAALLNNEVMRQAAAIGYINDFKLMMVLTLCATPLVLMMQGGRARAGAPADAAAVH